jgi:hypothetical protein
VKPWGTSGAECSGEAGHVSSPWFTPGAAVIASLDNDFHEPDAVRPNQGIG